MKATEEAAKVYRMACLMRVMAEVRARQASPEIIQKARRVYCRPGAGMGLNIRIKEEAMAYRDKLPCSKYQDPTCQAKGFWVQAWVFVRE